MALTLDRFILCGTSQRHRALHHYWVAMVAVTSLILLSATARAEEDGVGAEGGSNERVEDNRVLRHAVFFKFKESSSKEDIQEVVDAFCALPSKIDSITDFEWGTNNSPEGLDDGFTHCFLLTFKDEKGRAAYLPHPEHKVFGSVLRPHLEDVFVIDYWGEEQKSASEKLLRHAVFFKFKDDASPEEVKRVKDAFAELPAKIEAIKSFEWGKNNSPESHDDGFTHAFLVTFESEEGRAAYLPHDEHQAFVKQLMPVLEKVRVLDWWAKE